MKLFLPSLILTSLLVLVPMNAEAKTFDNGNYKFEFPNGCKMEKNENRFSSADAELECKGDAGFRFESGRESASSFANETDDQMVSALESVLEKLHYGSTLIESDATKYVINNQSAPYIIGTYDQDFSNAFGMTRSEEWALMVMVIKLDNGEPIIMQYRNNEDDFDKDLPMAEKIAKSVVGEGRTIDETEIETTSDTDATDTFERFCNLVGEKREECRTKLGLD